MRKTQYFVVNGDDNQTEDLLGLVSFFVYLVVVVVVVMTGPSGTAYMGGTEMSRRDEEFHQTLNPEGSVSPS